MAKDQDFASRIASKTERKERARRVERHQIWSWLGLFGMIGWSIAIPTLIGIAVGAWLDRRDQGGVSWTLMLLLLGAALGSFTAWRWARRESDSGRRPPSTPS
jgi:ATP synthase protein I